jgi:hypothetical protein
VLRTLGVDFFHNCCNNFALSIAKFIDVRDTLQMHQEVRVTTFVTVLQAAGGVLAAPFGGLFFMGARAIWRMHLSADSALRTHGIPASATLGVGYMVISYSLVTRAFHRDPTTARWTVIGTVVAVMVVAAAIYLRRYGFHRPGGKRQPTAREG